MLIKIFLLNVIGFLAIVNPDDTIKRICNLNHHSIIAAKQLKCQRTGRRNNMRMRHHATPLP